VERDTGGGGDDWGSELQVRDVTSLAVPLVGSVRAPGGDSEHYELVFPADAHGARAANAYLSDLADTFARALTLRSYGYDLLRWFRFIAAIGVAFDDAARSDYSDYVRWLGFQARRAALAILGPGQHEAG
jgi:hypothetical protein